MVRTAWNKGKTGVLVSSRKGKTDIEFYGEIKANSVHIKQREAKLGKALPESHRKNIGVACINCESNSGRFHAGESLEEHFEKFHGKEKAEEIIGTKNLSMKGNVNAHANIGKSYDQLVGKEKASVWKRNQRISTINYIKLNKGQCAVSFNLTACEYFKLYCFSNSITDARYAVYGNGEFYIKELGYFLDFISFEKKLIIEWDENCHYNADGSLSERDVIRQAEIQALYPDYEFRRIKHDEGLKMIEEMKQKELVLV